MVPLTSMREPTQVTSLLCLFPPGRTFPGGGSLWLRRSPAGRVRHGRWLPQGDETRCQGQGVPLAMILKYAMLRSCHQASDGGSILPTGVRLQQKGVRGWTRPPVEERGESQPNASLSRDGCYQTMDQSALLFIIRLVGYSLSRWLRMGFVLTSFAVAGATLRGRESATTLGAGTS
jgi:hypothetical protein